MGNCRWNYKLQGDKKDVGIRDHEKEVFYEAG